MSFQKGEKIIFLGRFDCDSSLIGEKGIVLSSEPEEYDYDYCMDDRPRVKGWKQPEYLIEVDGAKWMVHSSEIKAVNKNLDKIIKNYG